MDSVNNINNDSDDNEDNEYYEIIGGKSIYNSSLISSTNIIYMTGLLSIIGIASMNSMYHYFKNIMYNDKYNKYDKHNIDRYKERIYRNGQIFTQDDYIQSMNGVYKILFINGILCLQNTTNDTIEQKFNKMMSYAENNIYLLFSRKKILSVENEETVWEQGIKIDDLLFNENLYIELSNEGNIVLNYEILHNKKKISKYVIINKLI